MPLCNFKGEHGIAHDKLSNWDKSEIRRDPGRLKEEIRIGARWWKRGKESGQGVDVWEALKLKRFFARLD